jgi:hypothetical protein
MELQEQFLAVERTLWTNDAAFSATRPGPSFLKSVAATNMRFFIAFVLVLLSAACLDSPTSPDELTGVWGGEHVRLTILEDGGDLEFDCAHGALTMRLGPDRDSRFNASGYYVAEHGGPVRDDAPEDRQPAVYSGQVNDAILTFRFTVGDHQFGPFAVVRDRPPVLYKCL